MDNEKKKDVEREDGAILDDELLENVAGGSGGDGCPACGSTEYQYIGGQVWVCLSCGCPFCF